MIYTRLSERIMLFYIVSLLYCLLISPLSCNECGYQPRITTKIAGGTEAAIGSWPWMISLRAKGYSHLCGGVLIHSKYALTAGHCTFLFLPIQYEVHVGTHFINETKVVSSVTRIYRHPLYTSTIEGALRVYDYAVLELTNPVDTSKFSPICLPTSPTTLDSTFASNVTTLGWGLHSANATELAYALQQITIKLLDPSISACQESFLLNESLQLCAGTLKGGEGTCASDSGGPLMAFDGERWYVIGLTSYAWGCGLPLSPTIFLRVSAYIEWMRANIPDLFPTSTSTTPISNYTSETTTTIAQISKRDIPDIRMILGTVFGGLLGAICLVFFLIGQYHVFGKAGEPGWKSIIPIYSFSICLKLIKCSPWWTVMLFVPVLNIIMIIAVWYRIGRVFKRNYLFITGMILLPSVFWCILGFDKSKYQLKQRGKTNSVDISNYNGDYGYSSNNNHVYHIN